MKLDNIRIKFSRNFLIVPKILVSKKNFGSGPFDRSWSGSNRTSYRREINVWIFFKFWREPTSGPEREINCFYSFLSYILRWREKFLSEKKNYQTFLMYTLGLVIGHFDNFHIFRIRIPILFSLSYALDRCR